MRIGLAVSGGADSTALLVLMSGLREKLGFEAVVLHFDHAIRRESAADAAFVKKLAAEYALPFSGKRGKVVRRKGESLEMAARRERLAFFRKAMVALRLDCIATAHHMNDVAETFIMRLARSSGADGLAGLKPVSFVDGIVFIRPLLDVRGEDLRAFLRERGIPWREDATNADVSILRNKVRHVVLPFLERELDPKIVEHICRSAKYLRETARGCRNGGSCGKPAEKKAEQSAASGGATPRGPFALEIGPSAGFEKSRQAIGGLPAACCMSAAALRGRTIEVRRWREGDWMEPCGFPHRKKLQDIFVTEKVSKEVRHALPLVADAHSGEILWIPGYRVSESVKVESADAPSVRMALKECESGRSRRASSMKNG